MNRPIPNWMTGLSDEDCNFLKRFLLHSGSLKKVAAEYGVSYPTVRLRLDRLIQKVELTEAAADLSDFEIHLRTLLVDQKIDADTFRTILECHQNETQSPTD